MHNPQLNTVAYDDFVNLIEIKWAERAPTLDRSARKSGIWKEDFFPNGEGDRRVYSEFDREEYADDKAEGDQSTQARIQIGYEKEARLKRVGSNIGVTEEMRRYNKYREVNSAIQTLIDTPFNRMELDLTHTLTFAYSTSYVNKSGETVDLTVGDGLALASSVHTVRGSSVTYTNIVPNNPQVSTGALELAMQTGVENSINQFGELVGMDFDIIFSGKDPNTVHTIRTFLKSRAATDAPNEGVDNWAQGIMRHVILTRLATDAKGIFDSSKKKMWGIVSSRYFDANLAVNEEPHMNPVSDMTGNGYDPTRDVWGFESRAGYFICITNGRGIVISNGTGLA